MRILILIVILTLFLIINSCWILPLPQKQEISLPSLPPGWTKDYLRFSICYVDRQDILHWKRDLFPGEVVSLNLSRQAPSPILAYPHFKEETAPVAGMKPAGAVFPLDDVKRVELHWRDGPMAELLGRLTSDQRSMINIYRLRDIMRQWNDPWILDTEPLLEALLFHRFSGLVFKEYPLYSWSTGGSIGWWGDALLEGQEEQGGLTYELFPGIHRYISYDGPGLHSMFQINITSLGWTKLNLGEATIERGYWE